MIGQEYQRIEKVVVDAAIDHVHALQPFGGAHVDDIVLDHQIAALDQLDAHLVGEEGMLVIGAVVDARRQQRDHWSPGAIGRRHRRSVRAAPRDSATPARRDKGRPNFKGVQINGKPSHATWFWPVARYQPTKRCRRGRVVFACRERAKPSALSPPHKCYPLPGNETPGAHNASAGGTGGAIDGRFDLGVEPALIPCLDLH